MATNIAQGYNPSTLEPIDSRFIAANEAARLGVLSFNVYEGLTVYQQDTNEYYILINASVPSSNDSWALINTGNINNNGDFVTTSSFNEFTSSINVFTSSTNESINNINNFTGSINSFTSSVNNFTSSINEFTSSVNSFTSSINTFTSSINEFTSSVNSFTSSINEFTSSVNSFTSSINDWTGSNLSQFSGTSSFATTAGTANSVPLVQGPGIFINNLEITASVRTVNGVSAVDGNISVALAPATLTGLSSSLSGSPFFLPDTYSPRPPVSGTIFVVSGETGGNSSKNGETYVFITSSTQAGQWQQIYGFNTAAADARYARIDVAEVQNLTSSYASTASFIASSNVYGPHGSDSILSASYAVSSSQATSASYAISSSQATSASYAISSSQATSASYAISSSQATSASYAISSSQATSASYAISSSQATSASYAATSSIIYISSSNFSLSELEIFDYSTDVTAVYTNNRLKLIFGLPQSQSISDFTFNSTFETNRFNKVLDAYTASATWNNNAYTLIAANIFTGSTLLATTAAGTSLNYQVEASGSQQYRLEITASSPLDNSIRVISQSLLGTLNKVLPSNPIQTLTPTIQLGASSNQIEQGATGSISLTSEAGANNGWNITSFTGTGSFGSTVVPLFGNVGGTQETATFFVTASATGSNNIIIASTASYSSLALNNPVITTSSFSSQTYAKIRSLRVGASSLTSFTQAQLENLVLWDTTLGGSIGTIYKGTTTATGQLTTITWTGDKYHYIVYNSSAPVLSNIQVGVGGTSVISQFGSPTIVGNYRVYRTTTVQSGYTGTTINYYLT